jgi:hypothetical protein
MFRYKIFISLSNRIQFRLPPTWCLLCDELYLCAVLTFSTTVIKLSTHLKIISGFRPSTSVFDFQLSPYNRSTLNSLWLSLLADFLVKVKVTLRLVVYRKSVNIGVKPLETHDQRFSSTEPLRSSLVCNILPDEKMGVSLMNMLSLSSSVRIAHIACYWKFFLLHYIQVPFKYRLCKVDHACLIYLMF